MATSHAALSFVTNTWKSILTPALEQPLAGNWLRERRGGQTDTKGAVVSALTAKGFPKGSAPIQISLESKGVPSAPQQPPKGSISQVHPPSQGNGSGQPERGSKGAAAETIRKRVTTTVPVSVTREVTLPQPTPPLLPMEIWLGRFFKVWEER